MKRTTEEYITRAIEVHGIKYDYSKTIYLKSRGKIIVICPKHGEFVVSADAHLDRRGCKMCGNNMLTKDEFIEQANKKHNNYFDYKNVVYINKKIKVNIICPKHGSFEQLPEKHLSGQGCPFCNRSEIFGSGRITLALFIENSNKTHNNRYDYSLIKNINKAKDKVKIICNTHGVFEQEAHSHMKYKNGCPNCGFNTSLAGDEFIKSFNNINIIKEKCIKIGDKNFKVDGYDPETNTIYEYFGTFWHGHPDRKDLIGLHPYYKIPYSDLYSKTLNRIKLFEDNGYKVIYKWGR